MITKAIVVVVILLPTLALGQDHTATNESDGGGAVYLHETFEDFEIGSEPKTPVLQRVNDVTVVDGGGKIGSGKVARFDDADTSRGGAMEYNVGESPLGAMYVEFDGLNNDPTRGDKSSTVIFGVGPWATGKSLGLNAKAKRAFGFEMYQQKYLKFRIGDDTVAQSKYDAAEPFNVKIWVNDNDENPLSYKRPDSGESAELNPDSAVVWVNDSLIGELEPSGSPMHPDVTQGNAVLGRVGFSSSSTKVADFLIDNLHVEDPTGKPASSLPPSGNTKDGSTDGKKNLSSAVSPSATGEVTLARLPGAETMVYREGDDAMNLFVFKPEGWKAGDKRSAFIFFFGGGWSRGTPMKSSSKAAWAAKLGMVGIAPDYRTKSRFGTSPLASVDDGRAAFDWVLKHADDLGIDPARVAVGGSSAGGHVALWTAIEKAPPGSNPMTSPQAKPAALFLTSAVTDTSTETGYTPKRFGDDANALSPVHQLDANMPPTMMFHAANDELVSYGSAVALHDKLDSSGNVCDLITVPVGGHGFSSEYPEWQSKVKAKLKEWFEQEGLLPAVL